MRIQRRMIVGALGLVTIAACGDDGAATAPDASVVDASRSDATDVDAGPDASVSGTCGLQSFDSNEPLTGITVVFSNPDGSLLHDMVPTNSGLATFDGCVPNTMVTVALSGAPGVAGGGAAFTTITYTGVNPGTIVEFREPAFDDLTDAFTFTLSDTNTPGAAVRFGAHPGTGDGCYGNNDVNLLQEVNLGNEFTSCAGNTPATMDLLAIAYDDQDAPVGFDWATDITVVAPGGGATAAGTLDGWTGAVSADFQLTNMVDTIDSINLHIAHVRDGVEFFGTSAQPTPAAGTIDTAIPGLVPAGFADQITHSALLNFQLGGLTAMAVVGTQAANYSIDYNALLPRVTGMSITATGPRPSITWTTDGSFAGIDFGYAAATWQDGNFAAHEAHFIIHDAGAGQVRMPVLPTSLAEFLPMALTTFDPIQGAFVDSPTRTYDDFLTSTSLQARRFFSTFDDLFRAGEGGRLSVVGVP